MSIVPTIDNPTKQVQRFFDTVQSGFSHPNKSPRSIAKYQAHNLHLLSTLEIIALINTQRISPDYSRLVLISQTLKCTPKISLYRNLLSVTRDFPWMMR